MHCHSMNHYFQQLALNPPEYGTITRLLSYPPTSHTIFLAVVVFCNPQPSTSLPTLINPHSATAFHFPFPPRLCSNLSRFSRRLRRFLLQDPQSCLHPSIKMSERQLTSLKNLTQVGGRKKYHHLTNVPISDLGHSRR